MDDLYSDLPAVGETSNVEIAKGGWARPTVSSKSFLPVSISSKKKTNRTSTVFAPNLQIESQEINAEIKQSETNILPPVQVVEEAPIPIPKTNAKMLKPQTVLFKPRVAPTISTPKSIYSGVLTIIETKVIPKFEEKKELEHDFNHENHPNNVNYSFECEDPYDPAHPNDYLAYCEERLEQKRIAILEEENLKKLAEIEEMRKFKEKERQEAIEKGDLKKLQESMLSSMYQPSGLDGTGRGRGRGVLNLPAWIMNKQLNFQAGASSQNLTLGGPTSDIGPSSQFADASPSLPSHSQPPLLPPSSLSTASVSSLRSSRFADLNFSDEEENDQNTNEKEKNKNPDSTEREQSHQPPRQPPPHSRSSSRSRSRSPSPSRSRSRSISRSRSRSWSRSRSPSRSRSRSRGRSPSPPLTYPHRSSSREMEMESDRPDLRDGRRGGVDIERRGRNSRDRDRNRDRDSRERGTRRQDSRDRNRDRGSGSYREYDNQTCYISQYRPSDDDQVVPSPPSSTRTHSSFPLPPSLTVPSSTNPSNPNRDGQSNHILPSSSSQLVQPVFTLPSTVLLLKNMVSPSDVDSQLANETRSECERFGPVKDCLVHVVDEGFVLPPTPSTKGGRVMEEERVRTFIHFERQDSSIRAFRDMDGRFFGGRKISATFFPINSFLHKQFDPIPGDW